MSDAGARDRIKMPIGQLSIGMYVVELDRPWGETAFLFQGFRIRQQQEILLLAEVVAAFYEKYDDMPAQRLSLVLRLNHRKFPSALVAFILPLLQELF